MDVGPVPEIPVETFLATYLPSISKFEKRVDTDSAMGISHEQRSKQLLADIIKDLQRRRRIINQRWADMQQLPAKMAGQEPDVFNKPVQAIGNAVIETTCDLLERPKRLAVYCDGSRSLHSERLDECKPDGVIHLTGEHVKHKAAAPGQTSVPHREDVVVVLEFKKSTDFVCAGLLFSLDCAH
jgi:hypothetical protein